MIIEVAERKALKRMKKISKGRKGNEVQISDVIPEVWPLELDHIKMC